MHLIIPKDYNPVLNLRDTEIAIKLVKDFFETELAKALNLTRVSAPIMVTPESGLNDNLNGVERPVSFDVLETGKTVEIVHSLAKWKRQALKNYGFHEGEGLYTDMNAIRRDEITDNIHSIFVDQWDWERILGPDERNEETLRKIVRKLKSGQIHDGRAPDYDDWSLNGDILLYDPLLDIALEVSSMGIRVNPEVLMQQLKERGCEERAELPFQKALLAGELPQTIGGGIGQSRMCVYLLRKAHVGEVQAAMWPDDVVVACREANIQLL